MVSIINTETGKTIFTGLDEGTDRAGAIEALVKWLGFPSVQAAERQMGGFGHLLVVSDGIEVESKEG